MEIIKDKQFLIHIDLILEFIAKDSFHRSSSFLTNLNKKLFNLKNMPYKFRKSFYYEDENVRDLIFKGYTIPYLIDRQKNVIVILDIFKWQDK